MRTGRQLLTFSLTLATGLAPLLAQAAPGTLPRTPIFLSTPVEPNFILAIDDSASMDFEIQVESSDGTLWWHTGDLSFVGRNSQDQLLAGVVNVNRDGNADSTWKKFGYLFPNGHSLSYNGQRIRGDAQALYALPPVDAYAYARSPDYNVSYYNPDTSYSSWPARGGYSFGNANPSSARFDPLQFGAGSLDLTHDFDNSHPGWNQDDWKFKLFPGMRDENDVVVVAEELRNIAYYPATYYRKAGIADNTGYSADPSCATCLAPDGSLMDRYEIKSGNYSSASAYLAAIQNFANWFTYYRKRHLALRGSLARGVEDIRGAKMGSFTTNNRTTVTMRDMDSYWPRYYLLRDIYQSAVRDVDSSPNRSALNHAGSQFGRSTNSPVPYQCERNTALLASDGYADDENLMQLGNEDFHKGPPYEDGYNDTLADVAMRYYDHIGSSPYGTVTPPAACSGASPDPSLDCNAYLHMNTLGVVLGGKGDTLFDITHSSIDDAYTTPPAWTNPGYDRHPQQLDDLYHAAVNGRGDILQASSPAQLSAKLQTSLNQVVAHQGSAAAIGFSSYSLRSDSKAFISQFNSASWNGDLIARSVNRNGSLGATVWSAADKLDNRSAGSPRSIISYNPVSGNGIPFAWDKLSTAQKDDLRTNRQGNIEGTDNNAKERLLYIQGKRGCEKSSSSSCSVTRSFRNRSSILGDIIHASAVHVGAAEQNWPERAPFPATDKYSDFKQAHASRQALVYVGGNDGMLHAFKANNGEEHFAYIPAALFSSATTHSGLHYLTQPNYRHNYYVDASVTVSDAYFNNHWNTVLVGGLRGGGRGIYALNITDPDVLGSASIAASQVMWEFSHPDLGYTYGQPLIAPVGSASGIEWYAIVANGYNDNSGGSHDGQAQLFMLKLSGPGSDGQWDEGTDYFVLSTGVGNGMQRNGLSAPQVVDYNGDRIADRVYAGDLFGNLWAFDIRGSSASWSGSSPTRLFTTVNNQAITARPTVSFNPNMPSNDSTSPNLMVMFGSGQYLVDADRTTTTGQYLYGIWDNGSSSTVSQAQLVEQGPFQVITTASGSYRVMSAPQAVAYADPVSPDRGWYVALNETGERVVEAGLVNATTVYFASMIPSTQACEIGGSGWLLALDLATGARTAVSVFDVDHDYYVNQNDTVDDGGNSVVASGTRIEGGLPTAPSKIGSTVYTADSSVNTHANTIGNGETDSKLIRQSWRRLYYDQLN